ncbi:high affinity copper uptake protein 1-like [Limulus polyphemus]|uniref:Copper transport protein n=1 Tax=Limulus polyphemus TaxID=6850 RepID=A0ABM1BQ48_LIMPO|nr:high affinity copper uptake protein 1-like [Limulus polyphemus]XP_022254814.1 high affinity copper uptake protein 1-like [Limulus polyphemus]
MDHKGMDGMMMMMQMYFTTDVEVTILFKRWHVKNVGELIGSAIFVCLLAIFYEGLKYFRDYLFRKEALNEGNLNEQRTLMSRLTHRPHVIQTMLHVVQFVISYFLMLIFMTYNVWLCISVALGAGVGFFLFGGMRDIAVHITEHCH